MTLHADQVSLTGSEQVVITSAVPNRGAAVPRILYAKTQPPSVLREDFCTTTDVLRSSIVDAVYPSTDNF